MSTIERSIAEIPTQDAAPQRNSTGVVVVAIVGLLALVLGSIGCTADAAKDEDTAGFDVDNKVSLDTHTPDSTIVDVGDDAV